MCYLLLESKAALEESVLWRNPGRRHGEELDEYEEEEVGEEGLEVLELVAAPLLSNFLERKARGLERKQEARAEREVLGESARLADKCWVVLSYGTDLLDGYTSFRRQSGAISLSTSTLQTVCRRARCRDLCA